MSMIILKLLSIFGLVYIVKETDGPFGIIAWLRNFLMKNKYLGVFFYNLLSCYACCGLYAGAAVYSIAADFHKFSGRELVLWALAGSGVSIILNATVSFLLNSRQS